MNKNTLICEVKCKKNKLHLKLKIKKHVIKFYPKYNFLFIYLLKIKDNNNYLFIPSQRCILFPLKNNH